MKKKLPLPIFRLPVDFGNESLFPVSIQTAGHGGTLPPGTLFASRLKSPRNGESKPNGHQARDLELQLENSQFRIQHSSFPSSLPRRGGFTLVEILVVLALLSLIVFALMTVFAATQRAFRASMTQSDSLEGGRAVMDLMAADLATMIPSGGQFNIYNNGSDLSNTPVNFLSTVKTFPAYPSAPPYPASPPSPLYQSLIGSPDNITRTNVLEDIFILGKGNLNGVTSWIATGYSVNTNLPDGTLYPLYRFYMTTNASSGFAGQQALYDTFAAFNYTNSAVWSHLIDGVVHLTARAYDTNGILMTNGYANPQNLFIERAAYFVQTTYGEVGCLFCSNALPASVEIQLGTFEDRTLEHAESLNGINQSNFLANSSGQVHLFNRRVWIRNLDPTAYQ